MSVGGVSRARSKREGGRGKKRERTDGTATRALLNERASLVPPPIPSLSLAQSPLLTGRRVRQFLNLFFGSPFFLACIFT